MTELQFFILGQQNNIEIKFVFKTSYYILVCNSFKLNCNDCCIEKECISTNNNPNITIQEYENFKEQHPEYFI